MTHFRCNKCEEKYYSNLAAQLHVQTEHDYHNTDHCDFIVKEIGLPEKASIGKKDVEMLKGEASE